MHELEVVKIRLVKGTSLYSDKELNSPEAVMELIAGEMALYDREVLCILNLKTDGTPINLNIVSVGTVNQAMVIPGDVFKSSILSNADHIIAVHNHPSGKILPSRSDLYITQRLRLGGSSWASRYLIISSSGEAAGRCSVSGSMASCRRIQKRWNSSSGQ